MTGPRPFVPWIEMETRCGCLRKRCKHRREVDRRNAEQRADAAQIGALTDDDVRWLRANGWNR